jgi:hypothetical protein
MRNTTCWLEQDARFLCAGCPPFGEIQGLFQDFQGPFSVNSRTIDWEKSLKMARICPANNSHYSVILIKITNVGTCRRRLRKLIPGLSRTSTDFQGLSSPGILPSNSRTSQYFQGPWTGCVCNAQQLANPCLGTEAE